MSEPKPPQPQPQTVNVAVPQITMKDVDGFAGVWNKGGVTILLDNTAKTFARDFANIVLKSFVIDQMKRVMQAQAAQAQQQGQQTVLPSTTPPAANPPKSGLIVEG